MLSKFPFYNNNLLHLYSAFLDTQSALHSEGGYLLIRHQCAASTRMMRRSHIVPERPPPHQLQVERRQWWRQCMGMIRRPWWSEASGRIWPGYTPTLFKKHPGIFNDHRESGPRFNVSSKRRCFLLYSSGSQFQCSRPPRSAYFVCYSYRFRCLFYWNVSALRSGHHRIFLHDSSSKRTYIFHSKCIEVCETWIKIVYIYRGIWCHTRPCVKTLRSANPWMNVPK